MTKWRRPGPANDQPNIPGIFCPPKKHRLATAREQALNLAKMRLGFVFVFFAVAWTMIGARLAYLTLSGDPINVSIARTETNGAPGRADIVDRNGTLLATSLPTTSLCVDSRFVLDPDEATKQLLTVLQHPNPQKLSEDLRNGKHCSMIRRHLTPRQNYEVNKLGIPGINFLPDERRIYPTGNLAAHIVGYSDIDNNGLAGVEKSMDTRLAETREPLVLSLDLRVQSILRQEMLAALTAYHAEAGIGIVMSVATGEILGLVSLPDFDPSRPGAATDEQRFNRATLGVYEMGSTFKIFNTALALDSGTTRLSDTYDTLHPLEIGRFTIKDFENEDHNLNVAEIFTHSSNIGSARMAQRFGGERQRAFFERLGLTEKNPVEIPENGSPLLPSERAWSDATTLTASYGQGIAVSAIQLTAAAATIINDGHPVRPTILKRDDTFEPELDTVISPQTSAIIRSLLRLVVTRGTAKNAEVEGYLIGGKTGTAQKPGANRRYKENARLSSFIGAFPMNAPRYMVFALLDNPKGNAQTKGFATAGWVVAPAVSKIVAKIAPILGLAPLPKELNEAAERHLLKPLGPEIVNSFPVNNAKDYASAEYDPAD